MAQFEFNEENPIVSSRRPQKDKSSFSKTLIKWGLARNERQANIYLFVLVVIMFGLIVYMNLNTFASPAIDVGIDPALAL